MSANFMGVLAFFFVLVALIAYWSLREPAVSNDSSVRLRTGRAPGAAESFQDLVDPLSEEHFSCMGSSHMGAPERRDWA